MKYSKYILTLIITLVLMISCAHQPQPEFHNGVGITLRELKGDRYKVTAVFEVQHDHPFQFLDFEAVENDVPFDGANSSWTVVPYLEPTENTQTYRMDFRSYEGVSGDAITFTIHSVQLDETSYQGPWTLKMKPELAQGAQQYIAKTDPATHPLQNLTVEVCPYSAHVSLEGEWQPGTKLQLVMSDGYMPHSSGGGGYFKDASQPIRRYSMHFDFPITYDDVKSILINDVEYPLEKLP